MVLIKFELIKILNFVMTILKIIQILIQVMEVTLELSDIVAMQSKHTMSHMYFIKTLATDLPVSKTLIEYNNNLEENNEEEKDLINIELTEQKKESYNYENANDFRWLDVTEEDKEDIALANFIENLQKQTDDEIFPKSNWKIMISYLIKN